MQTPRPPRPHSTGFTLIELIIVLCILSILLMLTLPNYSDYVRRTHRTAAQTALISAAQWMERSATANGSYPNGSSTPTALREVPGARYTIGIQSPDPAQSGTATYRITATRRADSGQAIDECGDFVINQANQRSLVNATAAAADCWSH